MKFDLDTAWRDAVRLARENSGLLFAISGIFVFLPYAVAMLLLPAVAERPDLPDGASFEMAMQAMNAFYAKTWWIFAIIAVVATIGQLSMLALIGRRASPTVGEAIGIGGKAILPAWLALILQSLGINFIVLLIVSLASLTGLGALAFVATLFAFGLALYLFTRLSLVLPLVAVDGEKNPIRALTGSWMMTKGQGGRLLAFYLLLAVGALVALLVALLVVGLVLSIGGPTVAEIGNSIATAAAVTAVVVLATSVLAAVHRQFRRLERSGPSVPPTA